jgi:hypothetical protein
MLNGQDSIGHCLFAPVKTFRAELLKQVGERIFDTSLVTCIGYIPGQGQVAAKTTPKPLHVLKSFVPSVVIHLFRDSVRSVRMNV